MGEDFSKIEKKLGLKFKNIDLLKQALTHRSFLNEHKEWSRIGHNERLEFLGDAVLGFIVAECLYNKYPHFQEGELTNLRATLINSNALLEVATKLDIREYLLVSKGEKRDLEKTSPYFLADTIEAIIGAIYLDQGIEEARRFVKQHILVRIEEILQGGRFKDFKSIFQEKSQEILGATPNYKLLKSWGPDHLKQFRVGVYIADDLIAEGEGYSKQEAETKAAESALKKRGWE
ncbi:MAG: ribonuclease III [Candidatus Pacebacteria bacterium]|nr:ribonuclease III [Candidatus Paceibacterota bacterium]